MPTIQEPIDILAGVDTDRPATSTRHFTFSKAIRFVDGLPQKIKGWIAVDYTEGASIEGAPRSMYPYILGNIPRYLIGTNTRLYDLTGATPTNITPVETSSVAVANSLNTFVRSTIVNPVTTINGSTMVTVDISSSYVSYTRVGDSITLVGLATTNGVPNTELNATHYVRALSGSLATIYVTTPATSSGTGGGGSGYVVLGTVGLVHTAHGLSDGDRIKISGATDIGGVLAASINKEQIIRYVDANYFVFYTDDQASSSVFSGGGASTVYYPPIDAGPADATAGVGYGMGLYGVGLYGVPKTSSSNVLPRLWSHDRFGDLTVSCPGNDGAIYSWDGNTSTAPAPVTNAPTANYCFVSNGILVALGYDTDAAVAAGNGISWCDQGGITNWTTNQAGSDTIEGAGRFISHASVNGGNLLFTNTQTYTFTYIGGQFIWRTSFLDNVGLIGQNARITALGTVYWMGPDNFYRYRGGNVEIIPSNSSSESTVLDYVYNDINQAQAVKSFAKFNPKYREVEFWYPSSTSNDPDRVARYNVDTNEWAIDEISRTAADYPSSLSDTPFMIDLDGQVYLHEQGDDDNSSALSWTLTTNYIYGGTDTVQVSALIPDYETSGNITMTVRTKDYPLGPVKTTKTYTVNSTTDRVTLEQNGRYFQVQLDGAALGQAYNSGLWFVEKKTSSPK